MRLWRSLDVSMTMWSNLEENGNKLRLLLRKGDQTIPSLECETLSFFIVGGANLIIKRGRSYHLCQIYHSCSPSTALGMFFEILLHLYIACVLRSTALFRWNGLAEGLKVSLEQKLAGCVIRDPGYLVRDGYTTSVSWVGYSCSNKIKSHLKKNVANILWQC